MTRGTQILIALGSDESLDRNGLGVVRIAQIVGQEKSQVSRALSALAASGLVDRDPGSRAYRLGWRFFTLAARSGRPRMTSLAPGILTRLVADLGETAHLSVLQGDQVLTLLSEAPASAISANGWSGRTVPVACTASGRVLLFDHDLPALERLFTATGWSRSGPKAPRNAPELYRRIQASRQRGYATVDEEFEHGLVAAAAPVRDFSDLIIASVNVSGPKFRLGRRLRVAGEAVRAAGDELSSALLGASPEAGQPTRRQP